MGHLVPNRSMLDISSVVSRRINGVLYDIPLILAINPERVSEGIEEVSFSRFGGDAPPPRAPSQATPLDFLIFITSAIPTSAIARDFIFPRSLLSGLSVSIVLLSKKDIECKSTTAFRVV